MPLSVQPSDFFTVASLVVLEGLLSADNALVLALLVRHLSKKEQDRALWYGLLMAFALRAIGIALAAVLIGLWWVCALGSLYLIFLTGKHFATRSHAHDGDDDGPRSGGGFWPTVAQVGVTDLFFAIDSILVAVELVHNPSKIWIVYLGGLLGILLLRVAAGVLIRLIHRYPLLDNLAYLLVGWAGVKLGFTAAHLYGKTHGLAVPEMPKGVFWAVFLLIIVGGVWYAVRRGRQTADEPVVQEVDDALEELEESGFLIETEEDTT